VLFLDIHNYLKKLLKKRRKRQAMIHKTLLKKEEQEPVERYGRYMALQKGEEFLFL
jgi:hypothetical protein